MGGFDHLYPPMEFVAADRKLFFSKNDPRDPRLGDLVKTEIDGMDVAILGYPDDEGIRLNGGREGSKLGPREIRHWLYRTTPHARRPLKAFCDVGDLDIRGDLEERLERGRRNASKLLAKNLQLLSLGGGNDYAYADGMAFLETYKDKRPLVINIDAHFDVRDLSHGLTSGTPFYRLLESKIEHEFVELGIQGQCNSAQHWDYVESKGGKIISLEEILDSGRTLSDLVIERLGDSLLRKRPTFVALDIDSLAWPYAIGSSASWPVGLEPQSLWSLLQLLFKRMDVRVFGIYEVSPPLDVSGGTAKLAAQFGHSFLHYV